MHDFREGGGEEQDWSEGVLNIHDVGEGDGEEEDAAQGVYRLPEAACKGKNAKGQNYHGNFKSVAPPYTKHRM